MIVSHFFIMKMKHDQIYPNNTNSNRSICLQLLRFTAGRPPMTGVYVPFRNVHILDCVVILTGTVLGEAESYFDIG